MNRIHKAQQQLAQAEKTLADAVTALNRAKADNAAAEATGTNRERVQTTRALRRALAHWETSSVNKWTAFHALKMAEREA